MRELVRGEAVARMSRAERLAATRSARLYFQRPEKPGFFVSETVDGPVVPVFTSWEALALFAGPCEWASTTAADLVELLPEGVRALVDPLGPHTFVLDAEVLREPDTEADGPGTGADGHDAEADGPGTEADGHDAEADGPGTEADGHDVEADGPGTGGASS
ncbi:hypothetical protein GCM10009863_61990 [Streptomyces axinellae]|uniref:SseB protein N-terminal domain-containing protein n=1 Tax=Streptomyces axinellae TaxID=552788 RepID=A0ABP6DAU9_9ACTN